MPRAAADGAGYRFEAGEPVAYKIEVNISSEGTADLRTLDQANPQRHAERVQIALAFQLMPIARDDAGLWKARLVIDSAEQSLTGDKGIKKLTFDRNAMRERLAKAAMWKQTFGLAMKPGAAPDDLFDEPVLVWFAADGALKSLQDCSELETALPGLNLRQCIGLALPALSPRPLAVGEKWSREIPVDLPHPPIAGNLTPPLAWTLDYQVVAIETAGGRLCARISVQGNFQRDGLAIPIHESEDKFLTWTTLVTRITDTVTGEYLFDLDQHTMRSATLESTYTFATLAGRKVDKFRKHIKAENTIRTQFTSRLVTPEPIAANANARSTTLP